MSTLTMRGICKSFGNIVANDSVDLVIRQGEVLALLGENGAGKTTLMTILSGLTKPDSGDIMVDDQPVQIHDTKDAAKLGIGIVTQHGLLIPHLTVVENIVAGRGVHWQLKLKKTADELVKKAQEYGLTVNPWERVEDLTVAEKQVVEILRLLTRDTRFLILDEPTAVLPPNQIARVYETVRFLASKGCAVVVVTHKLDQVVSYCDRVVVLRKGKKVAEQPITSETTTEKLATLMVGQNLQPGTNGRAKCVGEKPVLEIRDITVPGHVENVSLFVLPGEILGVAGVGTAPESLARSILGYYKVASGKITINGQDVTNQHQSDVYKLGVNFVPADLKEGLVPLMNTAENLALRVYDTRPFSTRLGIINPKAFFENAKRLIRDFGIKAHITQPVTTLSGGNMQMVTIARELNRQPSLLIVVNPTRGLDIQKTSEIRKLLSESGAAVLWVSHDLDELMGVSDRIVVMCGRSVAGVVVNDDLHREVIGILMGGETYPEEMATC